MFKKILIANRGEIALRIMHTARRLSVSTVAIYSDADQTGLHVKHADQAFRVGGPRAIDSYLNGEAIITVAKDTGAEAIHPGYGFLSENAEFAEAVTQAGLIFIGPPASAIRTMGLKDLGRKLMAEAGVPVLPGYNGEAQSAALLTREAERIGYPILIKPLAGGGGKGMHRVDDASGFQDSLAKARREAEASFADDRVLLEKFLPEARHIEIQIFADAHGNVVHLFERDCSLQRRHQKVIEEAPAPGLTKDMRDALCTAAISAAKAVDYVGAGTVEFIADVSEGLASNRFYFMEMNTRLQVEHPVTEMITGLDLVEWQLRIAAGEPLPLTQENITMNGHAVEARLYAEDPAQNFLPQTGKLTQFAFPNRPGLRIDAGVEARDTVNSLYDPMLAKIIAHGPTRSEALQSLSIGLAEARIDGCKTNQLFLNRLLRCEAVRSGAFNTATIGDQLQSLMTDDELPIAVIAAATLIASGQIANPQSTSPFDVLRNYRLWPSEVRHFSFTSGKIPFHTEIAFLQSGGFELRQGQRQFCFSLLDFSNDKIRVVSEDRIMQLSYSCGRNYYRIALEGALYELTTPDDTKEHTGKDTGDGLVLAPVPGRIAEVRANEGDKIVTGDIIATIEAMKMEFALKAARDGRVTQLNVKPGQQVTEGAVIAIIVSDNA